jgi:hypothetical protein
VLGNVCERHQMEVLIGKPAVVTDQSRTIVRLWKRLFIQVRVLCVSTDLRVFKRELLPTLEVPLPRNHTTLFTNDSHR